MKNPYISRKETIEVENLPNPRIFITHLPLRYLPQLQHSSRKSPKLIFVDRDLKEVFVSLYHYLYAVSNVYRGSIQNFLDLFIKEIDQYSPWIEQIHEFRVRSTEKKVFYILYKDIAKRFPKVITNIVQFLEMPLPLNQDFIDLENHFEPSNFKQNLSLNHFDQYGVHGFIRKCRSGKSQEDIPKDVWYGLNKHVENLMPNPYYDINMATID